MRLAAASYEVVGVRSDSLTEQARSLVAPSPRDLICFGKRVHDVVVAVECASATPSTAPFSEARRDSKSQQVPYRNEQYSRLPITFPIPHGISTWEVQPNRFSLI